VSQIEAYLKTKNMKLIRMVLLYPLALLLMNEISLFCGGILATTHLTWPLWPAWAFLLYRFLYPISKEHPNEIFEYWVLNFYSFGGTTLILAKAYFSPFSILGSAIHGCFFMYPFLFPLILLLGLLGNKNTDSRDNISITTVRYWDKTLRGLRLGGVLIYCMIFLGGCFFTLLGSGLNSFFGWKYFLMQDPKCYAEVADGFNVMMVQAQDQKRELTLHGDDKSLPSVLRGMHATKVVINRDHAYVMIGVGRTGLAIGWQQETYLKGMPWQLGVVSDGEPGVAYTRSSQFSDRFDPKKVDGVILFAFVAIWGWLMFSIRKSFTTRIK
jgi:hypothetical protein